MRARVGYSIVWLPFRMNRRHSPLGTSHTVFFRKLQQLDSYAPSRSLSPTEIHTHPWSTEKPKKGRKKRKKRGQERGKWDLPSSFLLLPCPSHIDRVFSFAWRHTHRGWEAATAARSHLHCRRWSLDPSPLSSKGVVAPICPRTKPFRAYFRGGSFLNCPSVPSTRKDTSEGVFAQFEDKWLFQCRL